MFNAIAIDKLDNNKKLVSPVRIIFFIVLFIKCGVYYINILDAVSSTF